MRSTAVAYGPRCISLLAALVGITFCWIAAPAGSADAQRKVEAKRDVSRCVSYQQKQRDDGLDLNLDSSCEMDLRCSMSWVLSCQGKADLNEASAFELMAGTAYGVTASAGACGERGWSIKRVRWSCKAPDDK
ncbi:MAG TPA: hypothetical protein VML75_19165 [Kofleriaceae bacterium]|nr:hypothetical protein [Kofleriaceae bacterium]